MKSSTAIYDELFAGNSTEYTYKDLEALTGKPYDALRHAARRRGCKVPDARKPKLRDIIQEMSVTDALEFLLTVFEQASMIRPQEDHPINRLGKRFTPAEARLMACLYDADGRVVSKHHLGDLLHIIMADESKCGDDATVKVLICRIRKKLPKEVGQIETVWGVGYRFISAGPVQ